MDQDKAAPTGAILSGSTLFVEEASKTFLLITKQRSFVMIGAIRG